jgi:hypothetical protein
LFEVNGQAREREKGVCMCVCVEKVTSGERRMCLVVTRSLSSPFCWNSQILWPLSNNTAHLIGWLLGVYIWWWGWGGGVGLCFLKKITHTHSHCGYHKTFYNSIFLYYFWVFFFFLPFHDWWMTEECGRASSSIPSTRLSISPFLKTK